MLLRSWSLSFPTTREGAIHFSFRAFRTWYALITLDLAPAASLTRYAAAGRGTRYVRPTLHSEVLF